MSTNAMVGWFNDKKGRWVHWDGYPSVAGVELVKIIKRDNPNTAMDKLVDERYGWSYLSADFQGYENEEDQYYANDPRFAAEVGYGVAYTEEEGQSSPDNWFYLGDVNTEWQYLVTEIGHVNVYAHSELVGQVDPMDPQAEEWMRSLEEKENQGFNFSDMDAPAIIEKLRQIVEEFAPESLDDFEDEVENFTEEFISLAEEDCEWDRENGEPSTYLDDDEYPKQYEWTLEDAERYLNAPGWGYTHDAEDLIKSLISGVRSDTNIKLIFY